MCGHCLGVARAPFGRFVLGSWPFGTWPQPRRHVATPLTHLPPSLEHVPPELLPVFAAQRGPTSIRASKSAAGKLQLVPFGEEARSGKGKVRARGRRVDE